LQLRGSLKLIAALVFGVVGTAANGQGVPSETEAQKIRPDSLQPGDRLGRVSIDGNWLVVSTPLHDLTGGAWLYRWNGSLWMVHQKLHDLQPPLDDEDEFGYAVDIHGDLIAVGAPGDDDGDVNSGATYLFRIINGSVVLEAKLPGAVSGDEYRSGSSVALSDDTVVSGSPWANVDSDGNQTFDKGGASIHEFSGGSWLATGWLATSIVDDEQRIGTRVAVTDNFVALSGTSASGNYGQVAMFWRSNGGGVYFLEIIESPVGNTDGRFGFDIAMDDSTGVDRLAVGEPGSVKNGSFSGAVHIFWNYMSEFYWEQSPAPDFNQAGHFYGTGVDLQNGRLLASSTYGNQSVPNVGRMDLFENNSQGFLTNTLTYIATDVIPTGFGQGFQYVDLSDKRAIGGVPHQDNDEGAAYVFSSDRYWLSGSGGDWSVAANWSGGQVPGPEDAVYFGLDDFYYVNMPGQGGYASFLNLFEGEVYLDDDTGSTNLMVGANGMEIAHTSTSLAGAMSPGTMHMDGFYTMVEGPAWIGSRSEGGGGGSLILKDMYFESADFFVGNYGRGTVSLKDSTTLWVEGAIQVGSPEATGRIELDSYSTLQANNVDGSDPWDLRLSNGTVSLAPDTSLACFTGGVLIEPQGKLHSAGGFVEVETGFIINTGRMVADAEGGIGLTISGQYTQTNGSQSEPVYGQLEVLNLDLARLGVSIQGTADFTGGVIVEAPTADDFDVGDQVEIVQAEIISGLPGVWIVPTSRGNQFLRPNTTGLRGGSLGISVGDLGYDFGFNGTVVGEDMTGTPMAVVAADANGDLIDDLLVVTADVTGVSDGVVDVWIGDGAGTLCLEQRSLLSGSPNDITIADFDNDGAVDLALVLPDENKAVVFANDGSGTFVEALELVTGNEPHGLCSFAYNEDGLPDLAVTNFLDGTLSLYTNTSALRSMGFSAPDTVPTIAFPDLISPGNTGSGGDKDDDVVVGGDGGGAAHEGGMGLRGGLGPPVPIDLGGTPNDLELVDLNSNGIDDVVATLREAGALSIVVNTGFRFESPTRNRIGTEGRDLHVGDIDDDGNLDLLVVEVDSDGNAFAIAYRNDTDQIQGVRGSCPAGEIEDCFGNCAPDFWVGDGYCDDGTYSYGGVPIYFNCDEFNCDEGDCSASNCTSSSTGPILLARTHLDRSRGGDDPLLLLASGDFDGDGSTDIVHLLPLDGEYVVAVQTPDGGDPWDPTPCPFCQADTNGDFEVNVDDLLLIISEFGDCADPADCPGDLNGDGTVGVDDLLLVLSEFGSCLSLN